MHSKESGDDEKHRDAAREASRVVSRSRSHEQPLYPAEDLRRGRRRESSSRSRSPRHVSHSRDRSRSRVRRPHVVRMPPSIIRGVLDPNGMGAPLEDPQPLKDDVELPSQQSTFAPLIEHPGMEDARKEDEIKAIECNGNLFLCIRCYLHNESCGQDDQSVIDCDKLGGDYGDIDQYVFAKGIQDHFDEQVRGNMPSLYNGKKPWWTLQMIVDHYTIHRPLPEIPMKHYKQTMSAMARLLEKSGLKEIDDTGRERLNLNNAKFYVSLIRGLTSK